MHGVGESKRHLVIFKTLLVIWYFIHQVSKYLSYAQDYFLLALSITIFSTNINI